MADRMAGNGDHLGRRVAKHVGVTVVDPHIDAGNALGILGVADDGAAGSLLEREVAAHMVAVMMGVEDMSERPALGLEAFQHRFGHGGINHRHLA